jgi:hypothetical protein
MPDLYEALLNVMRFKKLENVQPLEDLFPIQFDFIDTSSVLTLEVLTYDLIVIRIKM